MAGGMIDAGARAIVGTGRVVSLGRWEVASG
jgi:hypothetical protein